MDSAGRAQAKPTIKPLIAILLSLAAIFASPTFAQSISKADDSERLAAVRRLCDAKEWEEAAKKAEGPPDQPPELDYLAGMALAHLQRWTEAREAFTAGIRKAPTDKRFPSERAGAAYRLNDIKNAKKDLQRVLRIDPKDPYALEFLGTIYLLEGNTDAALKYWNPLEKPRLSRVDLQPEPQLAQQLIERAVTFAAPAVLTRAQLLATNSRLDNLEAFQSWRIELSPEGEDAYKAGIKLNERPGWGDSWLGTAISLVSGLPYQTVYPEFRNVKQEALNFDSMIRWDSEKRRYSGEVSVPLFRNPARRVSFFFDARNENWNLSQTFSGSTAPLTDLNLRRFVGGARLHVLQNGRWGWTSGIEIVSRSFRNLSGQPSGDAAAFFTDSASFEAWLEVERSLLRVPERRFTLDGTGQIRFGRGFADNLGPFASYRGSLKADWLPRPRGDDYEIAVQLRGAQLFGDVPLDQLFQLGVERDNDLWLRGHRGTIGGRKGAAPLGRRYALFNAEFSKTLYDNPLFRVQCGPFFDSGAVADPSGFLGSQGWLWDTGAQVKVRVLGSVSVVLSYGWDLPNGKSTFYGTSVH